MNALFNKNKKLNAPQESKKMTILPPDKKMEDAAKRVNKKLTLAKTKAIQKVKLSYGDKKAIIRDILVKYPNYKRYGFGKMVQGYFRENYGLAIKHYTVSKIITQIKNEWKEADEVVYSKTQAFDELDYIFEKTADERLKVLIVLEKSKMEGHYQPSDNSMDNDVAKANSIKEIDKLIAAAEAEGKGGG